MTKRAACAWWPALLPTTFASSEEDTSMGSTDVMPVALISAVSLGRRSHHSLWVNTTDANRKMAGHGMGKPSTEYRQYLDHKQHCSQNLDLPAALRDATCVRWIVGWDLWQFITLWDSVECLLWNTGRRLQIIPAESAERPLRKHTTASRKMRQSESIFLRAEERQAN